jgi:small subunit ribosomal protein S2
MHIDLKQMLEAGVHFGHRTSRWSPKMKPFIWGAKNKIHLIDVSKTALLMERAGKFLKDITSTGGKVLFVGTKKAAQEVVTSTAANTGMPFVINRWVGGTLSNYEQVKKAITRLLHMRDVVQKTTTQYKKKELSMIQKEIARLEKNVGGIINFDFPPAALVIIDAKKEESAIKEAMRMNIPVVGLVDTNTDPSGVTHIIPANDDSPKSISFVMKYLEAQLMAGVSAFEATKAKPAAPAPKTEVKVAAAPAPQQAAAPVEAPVAPATEQPTAPRPARAPKKTDAGS